MEKKIIAWNTVLLMVLGSFYYQRVLRYASQVVESLKYAQFLQHIHTQIIYSNIIFF